MARPIRVFDGSFGRLQLSEAGAGEAIQTSEAPQIVVKQEGADFDFRVDGEALRLTREAVLFINPGASTQAGLEPGTAAQLLSFQASRDWLCSPCSVHIRPYG